MIIMNNHTDDYALVLEDRTEVKQEEKVGKLSVVTDINEKGKLKTAPVEEALQSSFLKSNSKDGLFENFMKNFIKQFNAPKRLGLYKVLASNVDQGVGNLKSALQNGQRAEDKATPQASQVAIDDLLPKQKIGTEQIFSS